MVIIMFGKLLKYEFKALFRKCVSIFLLIVAVTLGSAVITKLTGSLFSGEVNILGGIFSLIAGISFLLIAASPFIVLVLIINRFYTNFFKDEGYLTFTLPVKVTQLYNAKLLAGAVVLLFSAVVSVIVFILSLMIITSERGYFFNMAVLDEIGKAIKEITGYIKSFEVLLIVIEIIVYLILTSLYSIILFYLSFTIGAISAKKHKVALGVGVYYGINIACQFVISLITGMFFGTAAINASLAGTDIDSVVTLQSFLLVMIFAAALIATVLYIFNIKLLKNKLNLD